MAENVFLNDIGLLIFEIAFLIAFSLIIVYVMKKFGIPAVLGLIVGGLLLGILTEFQVFSFSNDFTQMKFLITELALAWIGFDIGNELNLGLLKEKGKDYGLILIGEAFGAYIIVFVSIIILTGNLFVALILASIGMATAPASTSQILGEYKAKGELSQTILFVLAFDDLLAILFFNMALSFISVQNIIGLDLIIFMFSGFIEQILLSIVLGLGGALLLAWLRSLKIVEDDKSFEWLIAIGFAILGLTLWIGGSVILTMFLFGVATKYEVDRKLLKKDQILQAEAMMIPIVLLFFILVGLEMDLIFVYDEIVKLFSNIDITTIGTNLIIITLVYFIARAIGKIGGTFIMGIKTNLSPNVKNNLPLSFITQAGVAIGLAGLAFNELSVDYPYEANLILIVVTISVIIAEIIGPLLVKRAIFRAGEANIQNNGELQS
ncbi:MAG: hypothetical protein HeimC3_01620 [Candidatus Heimdallarchaeota archaeon LC_3]|nr:MAG: hypothetical protein HeimC3_01620 [Candidatus Heimdallarchaeota archaeon LC_3]